MTVAFTQPKLSAVSDLLQYKFCVHGLRPFYSVLHKATVMSHHKFIIAILDFSFATSRKVAASKPGSFIAILH